MRARVLMPALVALVALAALAALDLSCGISFPAEYRVEDLRVLNIIVDPPEVPLIASGFTATTAEQLAQLVIAHPSTTAVTLTALVAHPDLDATFTYSWIDCAPAFSDLACAPEDRTPLTDEHAITVSFDPIARLTMDIAGTGDPTAALTGITNDPRDLFNGLYAHLILRAGVDTAVIDVDTPQLDAEKRLVIFEPSLVRVTIAEARKIGASGMVPRVNGVELPTLCTRATVEDVRAIDEFLATREPNHPPEFLGIEVRTRTSSVPLLNPGTLAIRPGEQIELRGATGPGSREKYKQIDDNCKLVEAQETISYSWFVNQGFISSPLTVDGADMRLSSQRTLYTAPDTIEGDQLRVRIWSVQRDGRGGSKHQSLDVLVRLPQSL